MNKTRTVKTTPAQFAEFKASVLFYMRLLHLGEFKACFLHSDALGCDNAFATVRVNTVGRIATFCMAKSVKSDCADDFNPWLHGKHEACELLLWELAGAAAELYSPRQVELWTHAIIRRLELALPAGGKS